MREIKFRCWHKERNKMLDVFGVNFRTPATAQVLDDKYNHYEELLSCVDLMQFTGMKDCNAVEIYEGDILEDSPSFRYKSGEYIRAVVTFNNCEFVVSYEHPDKKVYYERLNNSFIVVGNIHQHAHLLEK